MGHILVSIVILCVQCCLILHEPAVRLHLYKPHDMAGRWREQCLFMFLITVILFNFYIVLVHLHFYEPRNVAHRSVSVTFIRVCNCHIVTC
jgi:hypothetical protein